MLNYIRLCIVCVVVDACIIIPQEFYAIPHTVTTVSSFLNVLSQHNYIYIYHYVMYADDATLGFNL